MGLDQILSILQKWCAGASLCACVITLTKCKVEMNAFNRQLANKDFFRVE